jgi:iron(III) transport system permease protein
VGAAAAPPLRLLGAVLALGFAAPLLFLLQQAAAVGPEVVAAAVDPGLLAPAARSLAMAGGAATAAAALGTAAAWAVTRTDLPGARGWAVVLALPLALPSYIGAFTLQAALAPGGLTDRVLGVALPRVEGWWAATTILALLTYPYVFLLVGARLRQLPADLEEAARLLGHPPRAVARRVVLPQVLPSVLAGSLLVFLYAVSDFGLPQLLRYDTLTRVIFGSLLDRPTSTALALQLAVLALLVAALHRAALGRVARGRPGTSAVRTGTRWRLGRWRLPAVAGVAALAVSALGAPLGVLAFWALRGVVSGSGRAGSVLQDPAVVTAPLLGSAAAGLLAAGAATAVVLPIAYLSARRRDRVGEVAHGVVVTGFALPGLVIALALSAFLLRGPVALSWLYQTLPVMVAAHVVHFAAQSLQASQVAVLAVPDRVVEAARTLGVGRVGRLLRVELPVMAPSLLAGAGLVLLSTVKELPATLLLSPPGFRTLATDVWAATTDAFWAEASVLALVLVALSAVLTWLLVLRRADALA